MVMAEPREADVTLTISAKQYRWLHQELWWRAYRKPDEDDMVKSIIRHILRAMEGSARHFERAPE
jgi:hypothetical protein